MGEMPPPLLRPSLRKAAGECPPFDVTHRSSPLPMSRRRALLALTTLTATGTAIFLILSHPHQPPQSLPGSTSFPAPTTVEAKTSRRDESSSSSGTSRRADRDQHAAVLASQVIARLHEIADSGSGNLTFDESLSQALARLDPAQHRQVLEALDADQTLSDLFRFITIGSLSSAWLRDHPSDADSRFLLETLIPFAAKAPAGLEKNVLSWPLDLVAERDPELAARWFAGHSDLWQRFHLSSNISATSSDPQGHFIDQPETLVTSFSTHTDLALLQIPVLVSDNRDRIYVALAQSRVTAFGPTGEISGLPATFEAFQAAGRTLDPAAATHLHELMLQGFGQGVRKLDPATAIAWLDSAALTAADRQTIASHFIYPAAQESAAPWTAWLQGKLPAAEIQAKLPHPAAAPEDGK